MVISASNNSFSSAALAARAAAGDGALGLETGRPQAPQNRAPSVSETLQ
jgi:hypothetical protein